ncbi:MULTISPECIES: sulfite exporter TauE/SafE family protein [unclassified Legionella]|uniref:sulfite exporter TauE/SafE family protein n=1 Tax=unclassified Legionella TaxID=2622702 RepID=UPI0010543CCE|nr:MULTISPECIES: sulfite exporter TauE/SafE family protein [unclassified Legionella]MDI9819140.1 sulfite exporter TauE/SafE family protein [Legionella sp. PL877]
MSQFLLFVLVGFVAQIVDGALGMAYGVISTGVLVSLGIPPMVASASVHTAEIATTGISGFAHAMFRNVDYALFRRLAIPGIIGSIIGAYALTKIPVHIARPLIAVYLMSMGGLILYKAFRGGRLLEVLKHFIEERMGQHKLPSEEARGLIPLGFAGGFFDATGGGGWGPIVNSTLLAQGTVPHYTIGSVNLTEFLVTISAAATFFLTIGISHWFIILGLIVGGAIAAPFAAIIVRYIHSRIIMLLAGILIIVLGILTIARAFL